MQRALTDVRQRGLCMILLQYIPLLSKKLARFSGKICFLLLFLFGQSLWTVLTSLMPAEEE